MERSETIGIVGGGQLGRLLTREALEIGHRVVVLDPKPNCPASFVGAEQIRGALTDQEAIRDLAARSDVVTWEIEHINANALQGLNTSVEPSPETLLTIQDKLRQKKALRKWGIPIAPFMAINTPADLDFAFARFSQVMIKTRTGGYDGHGNMVPLTADWDAVTQRFGDTPVYAEKFEPFQKELAVMVARDTNGHFITYPPVETVHENNICHEVIAPAQTEPNVRWSAREIAQEVARHLQGAGVFAIEMFLTEQGDVLVNEIAPRVHNSYHLSLEAHETSQFEQHIRAITGNALGGTRLTVPAAVMVNILGTQVRMEGRSRVLELPGAKMHLYGKRSENITHSTKLGHVTVCAATVPEARRLAAITQRELTFGKDA